MLSWRKTVPTRNQRKGSADVKEFRLTCRSTDVKESRLLSRSADVKESRLLSRSADVKESSRYKPVVTTSILGL
jgi:hypothetical protein